MSSIPERGENVPRNNDIVVAAVKFYVAFAVLVGSLYYAWNFVGPSGQTMSLGSFIAFGFRELILVGFFGVVLILGCIGWLVGSARKLFRRGGDAP